MRNTAISFFKGPLIKREIRKRLDIYEESYSREWIAKFQTERFNDVWNKALETSPFYRNWADVHALPRQISHIRELAEFPVLSKQDITEHADTLMESAAESFYVTGGSTGQPTKFPKGRNEARLIYANRVLTYSWIDIKPGDRYMHLWGHSHLFGDGRSALVRRGVRRTKDWLVGGHRVNVYNQSKKDLFNWVETIERIRPKFIVGYASALLKLAHTIEDSHKRGEFPYLQRIISTAETITTEETSILENAFGAPVANEYGAVEAGIIAHSRPSRGDRMQFLWTSLAGNVDEKGNLRLSTLDPRVFPLINYEIGDRIHEPDHVDQVLTFRSVLGRSRDQLSLRLIDGSIGEITMIAFVQALNHVGSVRTVQAAQDGPASAEFYVTGSSRLDLQNIKGVLLNELKKTNIHLEPLSVTIKQLAEPLKSVAGKNNLVVPKHEP